MDTTTADRMREKYSAILGPQGRIVIPADLRKERGWEAGTVLNIWVEGGELRLQSRAEARAAAKAIFQRNRVSRNVVDELITERHAEADRELAKG